MMNRIGVFTSGGDAPGMNACIRAVVRTGLHHGLQVTGIRRGYNGMIQRDFVNLTSVDVSNILHLGGTKLLSARSQEFRSPEGRQKAYDNLKAAGIEGLVAIGGDGTFAGAHVFYEEFGMPAVGCAGTIDNDLMGTDFTIGYDTAINTAMEAIDKIKDTANSHERLFFVEVMGRDAGFIALRSAIASGAEAVLLPETPTDIETLVSQLLANYQRKKTSNIVIVAEGDQAGGALDISQKVRSLTDVFDVRVTILGHIQRGGRPTCMERVRASRMGMEAVKALLDGHKDVMVGQVHDKIVFTPFAQATKHHQSISTSLLDMVEVLS